MVHWEDGGATDTANLVVLCGHHQRLHHQQQLGITGNADEPDGLVVTDHTGRVLQPHAPPTPPTDATAQHHRIKPTRWDHPPGERLQSWAVHFNDPQTAA